MEKIKILHLCDKLGRGGSTIHGVSQLFSWWWPRFDKDLFQLELMVLRSERNSSEELVRKGVPHIKLNSNKFNFFSYKNVSEFIRNNNIQILHAHGYGASNIGLFAARMTGIKSIVHEHFIDSAYPLYQKPFDLFFAKNADKGIAVSNAVKDFMVNQRAMLSDKIDVIYNGAPIENFLSVDEELLTSEKKRLGIPLDSTIVGTIGRLSEEKGISYFLDSAVDILKKGHKVHFVLFGDGPLKLDLELQCQEKGIDKHVTFPGYYKDSPIAHAMLDILVIPSLSEGAPLIIFEAFASGTPVISTDAGGLSEIVKNEKTGLIVPVKNSPKIAEKVIELLVNHEMAQSLSRSAREESENYSVQSCIAQLERVYTNLYVK